jgi:putative endonuclease
VASWYLYIVECGDGSLYTGATNDVPRRVAAHNAGKGARYTRARRPVRLVYARRALSRVRALSLEALVKQLSRAEKARVVAAQALPSSLVRRAKRG